MSCGKVKQNTPTDTFRKKRRRKTAKKKKRKTDDKPRGMRACLHSRGAKEESEANDCPTSLAERSVKVLQEKIMPAGRHFRRANGAAA